MGFLLFTQSDVQMLCAKLGYHRLVRLLQEEISSENELNFWKMYAGTCPCTDIRTFISRTVKFRRYPSN